MKFSSPNSPVVIAHRGDTLSARENSVDAIRAARALGADGVEIDVRMTIDGHLVLAHDPEANGLLIAQTQLQALRREGEIDLLDEGLDETSGLIVNLELKGPVQDPRGLVGSLGKTIPNWSGRRFLLTSFWVQILAEAHAAIPGVSLGILTSAAFDQDGSGALKVASETGLGCILPSSVSVSSELIERAHSSGISVVAWTENDQERFKMFRQWGLDGVITDIPRDLLVIR